jgi:ribosome biogenesis GTPase
VSALGGVAVRARRGADGSAATARRHRPLGGVAVLFADVEELAQECRFGDCGHESESGCAVLAAIASGALSRRRLDSYRKLQRESAWAASRNDARLRKERENRYKAITKAQRQIYAVRGERKR